MSVRDYLMSQTAPPAGDEPPVWPEETPIFWQTAASRGYTPESSAQLWALLCERKLARAPRPGAKPQRTRKRGKR